MRKLKRIRDKLAAMLEGSYKDLINAYAQSGDCRTFSGISHDTYSIEVVTEDLILAA